jgi:hypothetical protein
VGARWRKEHASRQKPDDQNADSLYVDHSLERHPGRGPLEDELDFGTIGKAFNKALNKAFDEAAGDCAVAAHAGGLPRQ